MQNKWRYLLYALTGGIALIGILTALTPVEAAPDYAPTGPHVFFVAPSGTDNTLCGTQTSPCQTIQYAINQASEGDAIHIATFNHSLTTTPYTGTGENVIELNKSLTLRGGYTYQEFPILGTQWITSPFPATIDGEGQRRALKITGNITSTLHTLRFANGYTNGQGGNIYAEDAALNFINLEILSGTAAYGGGMYLKNCHAQLDLGNLDLGDLLDNLSGLLTIQYNSASEDGGGIYVEGGNPLLTSSSVEQNRAANRGGGLYVVDSALHLAAASVTSNTATTGGGIYFDGPLTLMPSNLPLLLNSYIRLNKAAKGGGIYFAQAVAGLGNNIIVNNTATDGAGLYMYAASPQLVFNTIAQNNGNTGLYITHKPGSLWPPVPPIPSYPALTNTIVASHTVGVYIDTTGLSYPLENRATLGGTLWWDNQEDTTGPGEIDRNSDVYGDPDFTCTGMMPDCMQPYHLNDGSAAIDQGQDVALAIPDWDTDLLVDIDMQLRPSGHGYDIGADEVQDLNQSLAIVPQLSTLTGQPGQTVTHTHRLVNTNPDTATLYSFDVNLASSQGWATLVTDNPVTMQGQSTKTLEIRVTVPETATALSVDQTAITATSQTDPEEQATALDITTVTSSSINTGFDLAITKEADVTQINPGGAIHYTLTVTRIGELGPMMVVTLSDRVVPTNAIAGWDMPGICGDADAATGYITCTLHLTQDSLVQPYQIPITVTTTQAYIGLLTNFVSLDSGVLDANPSNNVAYLTIAILTDHNVYLPVLMRQ